MGGESVGIMANILNGAFWPAVPAHGLPVVDVADVVAAHSLAAVSPKAKGRRARRAANGHWASKHCLRCRNTLA